jgi:hypothetical protein
MPVEYLEYGDIYAVQTRMKNPGIARRFAQLVQPGDVVLGHSNGNAIWARALQEGAPAIGMIVLNGALEEDFDLPSQLRFAHVYYNAHDSAVPLTEVPLIRRVFFDPLWGEIGRHGYKGTDKRVTVNLDCGSAPDLPCLQGHSEIIAPENYETWGVGIGRRIRQELAGEDTWPRAA